MIIRRNYGPFVVIADESLANALKKINDNRHRIIFIVSENGALEGVLTDGDLRRWLVQNERLDLERPVSQAMNRNVVACAINERRETMNAMLSSKVLALPLIDAQRRVVAVALREDQCIQLGDRRIGPEDPVFVIAEIGNNHNGSLDNALRLIELAADAGADCAKFQMRNMSAMYRDASGANVAREDLGAQYTLDLLDRFQLSDAELFKVFDHCVSCGMVPLCTPWDEVSLQKLQEYGMPGFKVASADFTNHDFLREIAALNKPMLCSTGMTSEAEVVRGVELLKASGCPFVLLHCNSTYPTPDKDVNLGYLTRLGELGEGLVGYSGHERGIAVPIAAVAMGARVIEKHFTIDRGLEGNDHKVSLLPDEFAEMVRNIRQVEAAMGTSAARSITQGEMMNREVLAKSLIAAVDIPAGTSITAEMIETKSPGQGLQPNRKDELVGTTLATDKVAGDFFYASDLEREVVAVRHYDFDRPWGIPVRYHDMHALRNKSNMDLLEIHLSYKDLDLDYREFLDASLDLALVVHAPELFSGDHTLNLCSESLEYRARSISELQRVIDLTRELSLYFERTEVPLVVTNVGGFTHSAPIEKSARADLYRKVEESLEQLDLEGVEIIPQTMPPFPWHFGGQQFHNLFVDPEEIVDFCARNRMRICLDVSHSKLACTHSSLSFHRFLELVVPHTAHFHLADAKGVDGEGLQIGAGEVDWSDVFSTMQRLGPGASFIPEIWQGHKNGGEGAWIALERLERYSRISKRA